jgi:hypothetical protein
MSNFSFWLKPGDDTVYTNQDSLVICNWLRRNSILHILRNVIKSKIYTKSQMKQLRKKMKLMGLPWRDFK